VDSTDARVGPIWRNPARKAPMANAGELANEILHAPETAACEYCALLCHSDVLHLVDVVAIALCCHIVAMYEAQGSRIDAVTQAATVLGPVGKDMAQMTVTLGTAHFSSYHAVTGLGGFSNFHALMILMNLT
jgi:hypothetical protein